MSVGTAKDREIESRQDFIDKGSVESATNWCEDCRKVLGFKLIGGKDMEKAIKGITSDLKDLDEIAAFGQVYGKSGKHKIIGTAVKLDLAKEEFKGIAWDLKLLEEEYQEFRRQKKALSGNAAKNAKENQKQKKRQIEEALERLERAQNSLHEITKEEKERQKSILNTIKKQPDGKKILATRKEFGKQLVMLRKLASHFHKTYDAARANEIEKQFTRFAEVNWLEQNTATLADGQLKEITSCVDSVVKLRGEYEQAKKTYDANIQQAQRLMEKAERMLEPKDLTTSGGHGFLDRFGDGQLANGLHNYRLAGEFINNKFVTDLEQKLVDFEKSFNDWQTLKAQEYQKIKTQLENLSQREYQIVGLQVVADVVAIGDQQRDYKKAKKEFTTADTEAKRIIAADKKFQESFAAFRIACSDVTVLANKVTGDGQKFAAPHAEEVFALREEFRKTLVVDAFAKSKVPTVEEIQSLHDALGKKLAAIQEKIEKLDDPNELAALIKGLEKDNNIRPMVDEIQDLHGSANSAVIEYAALGLDPTNDPTKIESWQQTLSTVAGWLERRAKDIKDPKRIKFDRVVRYYGEHKTSLQQIVTDATNLAAQGQTAIDTARENLTREVSKLKKMIKDARYTTLRQATWHANAEAEVLQMEALLKTDNKRLMEEKLARAVELQNQCLNTVVAWSDEYEIPNTYLVDYDNFKDRLAKLIKKLKDKEVKQVVPRESERYAGKAGILVLARGELKDDGPGSMATKKSFWETKISALEDEVNKRVLDNVKALIKARAECVKSAAAVKSRISGELCTAIQEKNNGKVISAPNLPIFSKVSEVEGLIVSADTLDRFAQLTKQLENLDEEVTWAIEDAQAGEIEAFVKANDQAEEKKRGSLEAAMKLKARYNLALEAFEEAREITKKLPNLDEGEFKRFVGLQKEATGAFNKKKWDEAAKKMDLALRLMQALQENPMGSKATGRGRDHLKDLNVRWATAIDTLNNSLLKLGDAIVTSAKATEGKVKDGPLKTKYETAVVKPVAAEFDKAAFQRELLIMQGDPPRNTADVRKDLDNKKKYREQALVKVRHYQRLLQSHPMYQTVMFQSNPWRKEGGTVNALELMRAINDIDLNVQRGVG